MSATEEISLVDYSGTVWDLLNGPIRLRQEGLRGLHFPPVQVYSRESPGRPGRRRTGSRVLARPLELPLDVGAYDLTPEEFLQAESAFSDAVRPDRQWTLRVTVAGETRTLVAQTEADGATEFESDPFEDFGGFVEPYPVLLSATADEPFWRGTLVEAQFETAADSVPTFPDEPTDDYVLYLSSSHTLGSGTVSNPGDVVAWADYVIEGAVESWSVTVDGGTTAGGPVDDDDTLLVETNPLRQVATLENGDVVTRDLLAVDWRPIEPSASAPISVAIAGPGRLTARFYPLYYRAWGSSA